MQAGFFTHTIPSTSHTQATLRNVAYEAARTEPLTAVELARSLPPTRERDELLVQALTRQSAREPGSYFVEEFNAPITTA